MCPLRAGYAGHTAIPAGPGVTGPPYFWVCSRPPTSTQFSRFINLVVRGTCKALQIDIWINGRDKRSLYKTKTKTNSLYSDREALGFLRQFIRCSPQSSQEDCSHLGKVEGRTPWNLVPLPLHPVKQKKKKGLLGLTVESQVPTPEEGARGL